MKRNVDTARRRRTRLIAASALSVAVLGVAAVILPSLVGPGDAGPAGRTPVAPPPPGGSPVRAGETSLDGEWTVRALSSASGAPALSRNAKGRVWLTFRAGDLVGSTGCNGLQADYEQGGTDGQDLAIGGPSGAGLTTTLVGCRWEAPLVSTLPDVRHVTGEDDVRYLRDADWRTVAELVRRPPAAPESAADRVGTAFVRFALGVDVSLPIAAPVDLYLGGAKVGSLDPGSYRDRSAWNMCPTSGEYTAVSCPISALDVLAAHDDFAHSPSPGPNACVTWSVPKALRAHDHRSITVGSAMDGACADWAAVTLFLDDASQLVAVDLTAAVP